MTLTNGVLEVDAQDNNLIGTYEMEITMVTPDSGDQVFQTVKVVLNYCVITHLTPPVDPTELDYLVFAPNPLVIDLGTPGFVQVPACGYFLVETYTWTIPEGAPITQDTSSGSQYIVNVLSTDPSTHGSFAVTLGMSALYSTLQTTFTEDITFTVVVTDPCLTTEITTFTLVKMNMESGQTVTQDFNQPTISAGTAVSNQDICGAYTYTVFEVVSGFNTV